MDTGHLAIAAGVSLVAGTLWAYVGARLLGRASTPETALARRAFAASWFAASAYAGTRVVVNLALLAGAPASPTALAGAWATLLTALVVFAGLVGHLAFLLTGRDRVVRIVLAAYAVQLLALVAIVLALRPVGGDATPWSTRFVFERAPLSANAALVGALIVPAIVACAAYLNVLRSTSDPTARWRIALVAGPTGLWLVVALAVRLPGAPPEVLGAGRVMAAIAALATYAAYSPPAFARRRWGIAPLERSDLAAASGARERRDAREAGLQQRAMDLI